MKIISLVILFLMMTSFNFKHERLIKKELQFFKDLDGRKILANVDLKLEQINARGNGLRSFNFYVNPNDPTMTQMVTENYPLLQSLWNTTSMIFGATSDGVGIGTTFPIKIINDTRFLYVTNFHVVEKFCSIPEDVYTDRVSDDDMTYSCDSLFVLHNVAINTTTNSASFEGVHPFKSEVLALTYFDKVKDVAVFAIDLPLDHDQMPVSMEVKYDQQLLVPFKGVEQNNSSLDPQLINGQEMFSIKDLSIFIVAYSQSQNKISKEWYQGNVFGLSPYENEKKLGIVSYLKHDLEVFPGSSGAPMALSDGRVIGINTAEEIKEFYATTGWWWWKKNILERHSSYYAIPTNLLESLCLK